MDIANNRPRRLHVVLKDIGQEQGSHSVRITRVLVQFAFAVTSDQIRGGTKRCEGPRDLQRCGTIQKWKAEYCSGCTPFLSVEVGLVQVGIGCINRVNRLPDNVSNVHSTPLPTATDWTRHAD